MRSTVVKKVSDSNQKKFKPTTLPNGEVETNPSNVSEDIHKINRDNIECEFGRDFNVKLKKYGDIIEF